MAGSTETSEMLLRATERAVQSWMAIFLAGGSCEFKSPALQVWGLNAGPITQLQEVGHYQKPMITETYDEENSVIG